MQATIYPGDSLQLILRKACVALGGDGRQDDSVIYLRRKILALSGYDLGADYSTLFTLCWTLGGEPRSGDSVWLLTKKIATALIEGGGPEPGGPFATFGGDTIQTFAGDDIVAFP